MFFCFPPLAAPSQNGIWLQKMKLGLINHQKKKVHSAWDLLGNLCDLYAEKREAKSCVLGRDIQPPRRSTTTASRCGHAVHFITHNEREKKPVFPRLQNTVCPSRCCSDHCLVVCQIQFVTNQSLPWHGGQNNFRNKSILYNQPETFHFVLKPPFIVY